jgi:hypothetical protein
VDKLLEPIAIAPAHNEELGVWLLGEHGAGGVEQHVNALFSHEAADIHDDAFLWKGEPGAMGETLCLVPVELELLGLDPVVDHVDLVPGGVEAARYFAAHEIRAHDDPPCLVGEPVLLLVDIFGGFGEDAPVPALLGCVHRGDHGQLVFVLELSGGVERQPVVSVEDGGLPSRAPVFK